MPNEIASLINPENLDKSNYTLSLANAAKTAGAVTESDYMDLVNRIFDKLAEQIKLYTNGESDSVMNETAAALLGSVLYNCDLALSRIPVDLAVSRLFSEPIDNIYFEGLRINRDLILKALSMIRKIKRTRINVMCPYYNNVLNNDLEKIVKSYDPKFDAKRNLTDVDYKIPTLNRSVCGIGGILHLLEELQSENDFVNFFPKDQTSALFKRYLAELAHPAGDMINLGQLVFEHAVLSLMSGDSEPIIPLSTEKIPKLVNEIKLDEGWYKALEVSHKLASRAPERYLSKLLAAFRPHLGIIFASETTLSRFLAQ